MEGSFLIGLGVAWAVTGIVLSVVMRRRGHDLLSWLVLGVILGPRAVPLALERLREHPLRRVHVPEAESGHCDVLFATDGSEESFQALDDALGLLGPHATSLTVATVLDHDSREGAAGEDARRRAQALLDEVAARTGRDEVRTRILYGRADEALTQYAENAGIEVIVVGARGRGASQTLFGSVTGRLVGASRVPVMVGRRRTG
ncbi:MAG TPA: universal stress protein [Acidimicrobiia bacterium]|nr:universal stress protein [Acidimicrobiia bacterium]